MNAYTLFCLILSTLPVICSANPDLDAYLLGAADDISVASTEAVNSAEMGAVASWVENAQFRFNTRNSLHNDKHIQAYEIRLKPKAWGQRGAEQNILKLRSRQQDNHYQQQFNIALHKRYQTFLDYLQQHNKTRYLQQLTDLLAQETALLQAQVQNTTFDPEKLLQTELVLHDSKALLSLNKRRLLALQSALGLSATQQNSTATHFAQDHYISIAEMQQQLAILYPQPGEQTSSPKIEDTRLNLQLLNEQKKLLKSRQQFGINLLSFEYQNRQNDEMGFMFGINIPLGNQFNHSEQSYDLHEVQSQLNLYVARLQQRLSEIKTEISWLLEEFDLTRQQMQHIQAHLQKNYARLPQLSLKLSKEALQHQNKSLEIQQQALQLYISALALTGQLVQPPLRNWLKPGLPELSQH